jgi:hypothetical protein
MPALYDRFPLKFKLPEQNGGVITELDAFPGLVYYTTDSDVLVNQKFSSVFSDNFNVFSVSIAPRLVRYIPSTQVFLVTYYKGIYIYNPSIQNDGVVHECTRSGVNFSITGGSSFVLDNPSDVYYEGEIYENNLNLPNEKNGLNRTSVNDNINISVSPTLLKNENLSYFEVDGSSFSGSGVSGRDYVPGNLGIAIPTLNPGDYFGVYLKFDVSFDINSKPIDYCFFNLSYNNVVSATDEFFPARDSIPGKSVSNLSNKNYYNQSFALRFDTNLSVLREKINQKIEVLYDNFPPFFSDFREVDL